MTTTTASSSIGYTKYSADAARGAGGAGKDVTPSSNGSALKETDFLHLLTTQLVHQDPLNPESDTDFAAQMAQYSSLAEMRRLNDTMGKQAMFAKVSSAASLIGKSVITNDIDGGKPVSGIVSAVDVAPDGTITLKVGTVSTPIEHVVSIASSGDAMQAASPTAVPGAPAAGETDKHKADGPATGSLESAMPSPGASGAATSPTDVSDSLRAAVQKAAEQTVRQFAQGASPAPAAPASTAPAPVPVGQQ